MKVTFTIFAEKECRKKFEEFIKERTRDPYLMYRLDDRYCDEIENLSKEFDKSPFIHKYSGEIAGTFFDGKCAMFAIALDDGTFVTHPVDKCKIYTDQPEDPEDAKQNNSDADLWNDLQQDVLSWIHAHRSFAQEEVSAADFSHAVSVLTDIALLGYKKGAATKRGQP